MIRVVLPAHLRTLARVDGEVKVAVDSPVTQSAVLDALEARYPVLRGTIRDHVTRERRAFLRIFACEQDLSHDGPDAKLPDAVATGAEPLLIVGAMAGGADDDAIVLRRVLDSPRDAVWKAWTEPERLKGWWGPRGFTSPECRIDLRPGGRFHACMRSPDGKDFWSAGIYREVVAPSRIVVTDYFADEHGKKIEPTEYGMSASWPSEALVTLTFVEHEGDKTRLTVHHGVGGASAAERDMCRQGWEESLDKLAEYLGKESR